MKQSIVGIVLMSSSLVAMAGGGEGSAPSGGMEPLELRPNQTHAVPATYEDDLAADAIDRPSKTTLDRVTAEEVIITGTQQATTEGGKIGSCKPPNICE